MSKAIEGVALELGAVAVGAAMFALASTGVGFAALPYLATVMYSLAAGGIAMEAGALASALTSNRGMNITTRQAAANRQIIYGMQRVGGVFVYNSTTGSHKDQNNKPIILAGHECWAIEDLYLDGRRVNFNTSSSGAVTRNGVTFGGSADSNTYTGPDGVQYNFGSLVYAEARFGDQLSGDVIGAFTANDPVWVADADGSPYVGGCTYFYLKAEYDTVTFPTDPEIRVTVLGRLVFDPRTGQKVWSANAALVCADWASDAVDGLGLIVNQEQLIIAANICDEQVVCAQGLEARYACHHHFDTSSAPSDIFKTLLKSMGGRYSLIGGECYLWPAAFIGSSFNWDMGIITAPLEWDSTAAFAQSCNRVTGTYTAPNFPYNIAGNLYDKNGFFEDQIQNNFQFGFQPDNFPQYAVDPYHGYAADEYLNRDSGVTAAWTSGAVFALGQIVSFTQAISGFQYASVWRPLIADNTGNTPSPTSIQWVNAAIPLPMEVSYNMVLSISQAQRLAKIDLLRSRFWGRGTFEMGLAAFAMQPVDVFLMTSAELGWTDHMLEVTDCTIKVVTRDGEPGEPPTPPEVRLVFEVQDTDPSIYDDFGVGEEQDIYGVPTLPQQMNRAPTAPTTMELVSGAATALVAPDGTVTPRIEVEWATPLDGYVTQIQMQYQLAGAASWADAGLVDVTLNTGYISPVVSGLVYNVRIRSLWPSGAASVWVTINAFTAALVLSVGAQTGVGSGTLVGEAYGDGTAAIECMPFTTPVGGSTVSIFPGGAFTLSGLLQQTLYYVYYIDPTYVGGNVTPIATTNPADYLGKVGYFLIDSIVTPFAPTSGGSTGARYYPSTYSDIGTRTTSTPSAAYDGDLSTSAKITASISSSTVANGLCVFQGDPVIDFTSISTLTVVASSDIAGSTGAGAAASISASIAGTVTPLLSSTTGSTGVTTYTAAIPAGTSLSSVTVTAGASFSASPATGLACTITLSIFETYIQT